MVALVGAAILSALAWPGCSQTEAEPGTGETHFLESCDADCGGGLSCICGVCTKSCSGAAGCSAFAAAAACLPDPTCSGSVCGIECTTENDCRSLGNLYTCENSRCRERKGTDTDAGGVADAGNESSGLPDAGGYFSSCEYPPPSSCTVAETCALLGCGGLEFDEHGCRRPPCTTDVDCAANDRCTPVSCAGARECSHDANLACSCSAPILDCPSKPICNSTAIVGPRGDWKTLEVRRISGPCPLGANCTSWWRVGSDGGLAASKAGGPVSSRVNSGDLLSLLSLVNGPELRAALRDGIPCDPPPTDIGITIHLELSTETLERDVTGCVLSGPAQNVFQSVDLIVERY